MTTWYVIPARAGSKGFPKKNRTLVPIVLSSIAEEKKKNVIITTDDHEIIKYAKTKGIKTLLRDDCLASDYANMKDVMTDVSLKLELNENDTIVTLYPTYPQRKNEDIDKGLEFFHSNNLSSMLCRKKCNFPIPLIIESFGNLKGKPVVNKIHTRRQGWPEYFELCHFISIFKVKELENLTQKILIQNKN